MAEFSTPVSDRYLDDYKPGEVYEFGPVAVDEREVIAFAEKFDAQPIHTDPAFAAAGPFKGLIASGWHTIGLVMGLLVKHYLSPASSLASPGVDEVRWLKPVRPGDQLRLRVRVVETRRSKTKPDRGILFSFVEGLNQNDEIVVTMKSMNMTAVRPPG